MGRIVHDYAVSLENEDLEGTESFEPESPADGQSVAVELGEDEGTRSSVAYPSGISLPIATGPDTSSADEYWDPNQAGVPLVDTSAAQAGKRLSLSFTVGELARSGSHRFENARIDPALVRCLQAIRDRVGKAVRINSGYRSWGYNQQLYRGRNRQPTQSRHCSGQAADIAIGGMTGLDVAKAAIDACGGDIGVGIDRDYAHVDVRGTWAKWTYPGLGGATERSRALQAIEDYRAGRRTRPASPTTPAPARPSTGDADTQRALAIAASPVSAATGADPELPGVTTGELVERWRARICPEIPREILLAFIRYESGGRFDDATHGTTKNKWTSPPFYELGIFQTPAGLHGRCTSGDRRAKDCEFGPPGREKVGESSTWVRLCKKIGADPSRWRNPETQVQVGLWDLESGAAVLRKEYPDLFPTPASDWDLRMAVLYRFSRGGGAARSFLRPFRAQLAGMPEDQRWSFLRDKQVTVKGAKGSFVRAFKGENVEKKMALAARLGYAAGGGRGTPSPPTQTTPPAPAPRPAAAPLAGGKPAGELVRFAQRVLNASEGERLREDGDLGPLTRGALQRFRTKYGLGAGGTLDEPTQLALAQRALEEIGQQSIFPKFGVRDPRTEQALVDFKVRRGLGFGSALDTATRAALAGALKPAAPPPVVAPPLGVTGLSLGIDTASVAGNKNVSWIDARTRVPVDFAIIRSNWGVWEDRVFKRDWPKIRDAGIVRGAYLFLRFPHPKHGMKSPDPVSQANAVIKAVGPLDESDLPPTLDVEFPGGRKLTGLSAQRCLDDVRAAWRVLKSHYGVAPIIYTSARVWKEYLDNLPAPDLAESPLWLARYPFKKGPAVYDARRVGGLNSPPVPPPWGDATNWWIHQYQGDAINLPGFPTGNVDMNRFNVTGQGASGDRVKWVQRRLGIAQGGTLDAATESGLRAFQGRKGLPADGKVDIRTFARLCWAHP